MLIDFFSNFLREKGQFHFVCKCIRTIFKDSTYGIVLIRISKQKIRDDYNPQNLLGDSTPGWEIHCQMLGRIIDHQIISAGEHPNSNPARGKYLTEKASSLNKNLQKKKRNRSPLVSFGYQPLKNPPRSNSALLDLRTKPFATLQHQRSSALPRHPSVPTKSTSKPPGLSLAENTSPLSLSPSLSPDCREDPWSL